MRRRGPCWVGLDRLRGLLVDGAMKPCQFKNIDDNSGFVFYVGAAVELEIYP
jgi:hypothetical protein